MVRRSRKSSTAMTEKGKGYPEHAGKRSWELAYVDHRGFIIKVTRATTFDHALARAIPGLKKYGASGVTVEHHEDSSGNEWAVFDVRRAQRSRAEETSIAVRFSGNSTYNAFIAL